MPSTSGISEEIMMTATALSGELRNEPVDLRLGADVDAARRLVENENARIGEQPAGNQHLLLIAAGKVEHRLFQIGRAHAKLLLLVETERLDLALLDEARAGMAATEQGDLHVSHDVEQQETAALLAVLGEERHARIHGDAGIAHDERLCR